MDAPGDRARAGCVQRAWDEASDTGPSTDGAAWAACLISGKSRDTGVAPISSSAGPTQDSFTGLVHVSQPTVLVEHCDAVRRPLNHMRHDVTHHVTRSSRAARHPMGTASRAVFHARQCARSLHDVHRVECR